MKFTSGVARVVRITAFYVGLVVGAQVGNVGCACTTILNMKYASHFLYC